MRWATETGRARIAPLVVATLWRQTDEGWHRGTSGALDFAHHRTDRRPSAGRCIARRAASEALVSVVATMRPDHRTDEAELVRHAGDLREQLTYLNSGNIRVDRFELAADVRRRVEFDVEHVLMRRTTGQEDHDDGFVTEPFAGRLRGCFRLEELWERQAAKSQPSYLEESAS